MVHHCVMLTLIDCRDLPDVGGRTDDRGRLECGDRDDFALVAGLGSKEGCSQVSKAGPCPRERSFQAG